MSIFFPPFSIQPQRSRAAAMFIAALLFTFLSLPLTTNAQALDVPTNPEATPFSGQWIRERILNPVARGAIRSLLNAVTQSTVSWIQGDGGKNVGFVGNLEAAMRHEADIRAGEFLNQLTGINLCGNIGAYLRISLQRPAFSQEIACSITDVVNNVKGFFQDFQNGGWDRYLQISLTPQDNPYGAYLIAYDAKLEGEMARLNAFLTPLQRGSFAGFQVDVEHCDIPNNEIAELRAIENNPGEEHPEDPASRTDSLANELARKQNCRTEKETRTPGELISGQLNKAVGSNIDFAVNAKDFDEVIAAIMNALINRVISEASGGGSGFISSSADYNDTFQQIAAEVDTTSSRASLLKRTGNAIFGAQAAVSSIDQALLANRRELFALQAATPAPPSALTTRSAPSTAAINRTAQLMQTIANQLAAKNTLLAQEKTLFAIAQGGIGTFASSDIKNLTLQLNAAEQRVAGAAQGAGLSTSAAPASGDPQQDILIALNNTRQQAQRARALLDETAVELDRVGISEDQGGITQDRAALDALDAQVSQHASALADSFTQSEIIAESISAADALSQDIIPKIQTATRALTRADILLGVSTAALQQTQQVMPEE